MNTDNTSGGDCSDFNRAVLAPESVPAPKTDKELLRDVIQTYDASQDSENPDTVEDIAFFAAMTAAEERVND